MLLVQQRNPTDEMNEQRPQASFQNFNSNGSTSSQIGQGINLETNMPRRTDKSLQKIPQDVIEGTQILSIFFLGQNL